MAQGFTHADAGNYGFANLSGALLDNGINTGYESLDLIAEQSQSVWGTSISGNAGAGTFGEKISDKLLTLAKFLGLK